MPINADAPKGSKNDAPEAKKTKSTTSKGPHNKGKNRLRETSPLSTSPKCKKVFWPHGTFGN